jgi:hypothetical protein
MMHTKKCVAAYALSIFLNTETHASTQWLYGEGVCAGGWTYDLYDACPDESLDPVSEIIRHDAEKCGTEEVIVDPGTPCRDHSGALQPIPDDEPNAGTVDYFVKDISLNRMNQELSTESMQAYCANAVESNPLYAQPFPLFGPHREVYLGVESTFITNDTGEGRVCADRDFFKKCFSWHHTRSVSCMVRLRKMQYPEKICNQVSEVLAKSCVVGHVFPSTKRAACGTVQSNLVSTPFTNNASLLKMGAGRLRCATHDELPDQSPSELGQKVQKLLQNMEPSGPYAFQIKERSIATLRKILTERSQDLSTDHIQKIFSLPSNFRTLSASQLAFSEADVLVKIAGDVVVIVGPGSTATLREVKVSLPKFSDFAAICSGSADQCKGENADWFFGTLNQYAGNRYIYSVYMPQTPTVMTVKAMAGQKVINKVVQAGVGESQVLEPSLIEAGKARALFGKECWGIGHIKAVDVANSTTLASYTAGCVLSPDRKFIYGLSNAKLVKKNVATGTLVSETPVPSELTIITFRGEDVLVTDGVRYLSPLTGGEITLSGEHEFIYPEDVVVAGDIVAKVTGTHVVGVWSLTSGNKLFEIAHTVEGSSPPVSDRVYIEGDKIFIKSYADTKLRVYTLGGSFVGGIEVGAYTEKLAFTRDGKKVVVVNPKIQVIDTETGAVVKSFNGEGQSKYYAKEVNADLSLATFYVQRSVPGGNPNSPVGSPINYVESMELWRLSDGVRLKTMDIPESYKFIGTIE